MGDNADVPPDDSCGPASVGATPLRRLTRLEYDNTVRDLLGDDASLAASGFSLDEQTLGFAANGGAPVSSTHVQQYLRAAETLAATFAAQDFGGLAPCAVENVACAAEFIGAFGRRAFRRPLSAPQLENYVALYEDGAAQWGAAKGLQLAVEAMLVSPSFLYHVETLPSAATEDDVHRVDAYELGARLSYFLWASMPDAELLDAVEHGELDTRDGVSAQARRMLEDDKAEDTIASFHRQWLDVAAVDELLRDAELFPTWDAELAQAAASEPIAFADEVIRRADASLTTLLTAAWTLADADLAELYGVTRAPAPDGRVELDPDQRAGILTQVAFLAANASPTHASWVRRGKFVRERLLCQPIEGPPPDVEGMDPFDRGRLDAPECAGCHVLMDPIGIGFDDYDAIGAYHPAGAQGEVAGFPEIGTFSGAVELARALADSRVVHDCVATQWFRYATRRAEAEVEDACTLEALHESFNDSGGDIRSLLLAIATSDAFRYRRAKSIGGAP